MNDSDEYRLLKGDIFFLNQKIDKVQNTLDAIWVISLLIIGFAFVFWIFNFNTLPTFTKKGF